MQNERPANGFIRKKLSYREKQEDLRTINDIDAEYWTLLLFYSNVPAEGQKLLKTSSDRLRGKAYPAFSSFIKIAKTYYDSAKQLHHRAASLNYYYCFLNLAKAAIICNDPNLYRHGFVHGLSGRRSDHQNLFERTSLVHIGKTRSGDYNVFDQLYKLSYGSSLPKRTYLKLDNLIRYCSEAAYQNTKATGSLSKQLPSYYAIRVQSNGTNYATFWPLLAIHGNGLTLEHKSFARRLSAEFERVNLTQQNSRDIFSIFGDEHSALTYFQSIEVFNELPMTDIFQVSKNKVKKALGNHVYPLYYDDPCDLYITLPLRPNLQWPMNECLAIYVITHHLSELVRYRPQYLENLLLSKEAWVLESIVDTAPAMFLRGITALITQTDYRIISR
ncbi:MAG TPA: YaaC family protein [Patescibacteria group bacterium]|nr:YaaC family protein [Patescibacteria group bacterium]